MIHLDEVSKSYQSADRLLPVLQGIALHCEPGEVVSIVGPTGVGKTTLLNIIARVDQPDAGKVTTSGKVGYMMQDSALLPWRTLGENGVLAAEIQGGRRPSLHATLVEIFDAFGLSGALDVEPKNASGGMKQRVALIRTLLPQPDVLLLDEPFTGLDFDVKLRIQRFILDRRRQQHLTICIVTHDIEDAIALSDRIVVLSGRPASVKSTIRVDLGPITRDPVDARRSAKFATYFAQVWDELKDRDQR